MINWPDPFKIPKQASQTEIIYHFLSPRLLKARNASGGDLNNVSPVFLWFLLSMLRYWKNQVKWSWGQGQGSLEGINLQMKETRREENSPTHLCFDDVAVHGDCVCRRCAHQETRLIWHTYLNNSALHLYRAGQFAKVLSCPWLN